MGALISEYPPGTPHRAEQFPIRNRLISGLSLGVVAVECARFSGTMRTIDHALDQNRDVFAVPGNIDAPMSQGPNWLIQQGARPVTCGEDILADYWDRFHRSWPTPRLWNLSICGSGWNCLPRRKKEEPKPEPQQEKSRRSLVVLRSPCLSSGSASPRSVGGTSCYAGGGRHRRRAGGPHPDSGPAGAVGATMLQVDGAAEQRPGPPRRSWGTRTTRLLCAFVPLMIQNRFGEVEPTKTRQLWLLESPHPFQGQDHRQVPWTGL